MGDPYRWKINQPGSCPCPCGPKHCYWPCCVYGMQFTLDQKAYNTDESSAGLFICEEMYATVYHFEGGDDESVNHASFEKTIGDTAWTRLHWGGGGTDEYYHFGIPVETEDLLCRHPSGVNIELLLVWMNVCNHLESGDPVWDEGKLTIQDPVLSFFFDGAPYYMQCLGTEEIPGLPTWTNRSNACTPSPNPAPHVIVPSRQLCALKFKFGWVDEAAAEAARAATPHFCLETASNDKTIKAAVWTNENSSYDLPAKYTVSGDVCYKQLGCEADDDSEKRITVYSVESDCDDVDCRPDPDQLIPNCTCLEETGDWIWTDDDSVQWSDGDNAVWTDSLTCHCGCDSADLILGLPSYLALAKVSAVGLDPDGLTFQACLSYYSVYISSHKSICAVFAHANMHYGRANFSEFPFMLRWSITWSTWVAEFRGTNTLGDASFSVYGPIPSGIVDCLWHSVKLEYVGGSGWRLGIDINGGTDYEWGEFEEPPGTGFAMYGPRVYHWGAFDRVQPGSPDYPNGTGQSSPPNSLMTT